MPRRLETIDLQVPRYTQQTHVWCWAAVVQMIAAHFIGEASTPSQKEIARMALGQPFDDRWARGIPDDAVMPHSAEFIRLMVKLLSRRVSDWFPPCSAEELYANLYFGNPVILHVHTGGMTSHVIVVAGMRPTDERGVFEVLLNDPSRHVPGPFWARYDAVHSTVIEHLVVYRGIQM